ncbi:armadillo-type protein [Suillus paluster]|uniref:armadillo-type protein n=1 Tax=Suillus paluster TaxID=48578 RepID=UPI001B86BC59|nr:armadillo-type protein [Suillus paluster]KAG1754894.1 armadillo-type protein [Suillus paluster]
MNNDSLSQQWFSKFKSICVPLLEKSQLSAGTVAAVLPLLSSLESTLLDAGQTGFTLSQSLVSYIFFPLSTILRRNDLSAIPDQVLEKIFGVLAILCETWWWSCDTLIWDQIFKLCSSIIGGVEGKGKGKIRDDETKEAAARCLWAIVRQRRLEEAPQDLPGGLLRDRSQQFMPVLGQTINTLLLTAKSPHLPLQRISLKILHALISVYASEQFLPSILPGVVSSMAKIKGLEALEPVIVKSLGDEVCIREDFINLADDPTVNPKPPDLPPYLTPRTSSWLRASASQLHIALNSLTPLVNHPTPLALVALSSFSRAILASTHLTLPQSRPLLFSFPEVCWPSASDARLPLLQALLEISKENLSSLPRSIVSQDDTKVEHIAGQIEAICLLATSSSTSSTGLGLPSISLGIDTLLGPTGGIEKWGYTLLSVLEFTSPQVNVSQDSVAQLLLEDNADNPDTVNFPEAMLKNVLARSTRDALARMLRALGRISGENCIYAVEWFVSTGRYSRTNNAVAALWCAARLLEGISGFSLDEGGMAISSGPRSRKLERFARGLARDLAELWDEEPDFNSQSDITRTDRHTDDSLLTTEFTKGFKTIRATLQVAEPRATVPNLSDDQPILHKIFCLQLLSISAGILQARYASVLIQVLYPILHSIVSPTPHLSLTGLATLHFVSAVMSYASPANLLLSNFDYALDSVSRRLSRRWLDVDATKVMAVLVRLVGADVVQKAGDVVEECFDRLDEYHGYDVIVQGLVGVLGEVIKVIEEGQDDMQSLTITYSLEPLFEWLTHRNDLPPQEDTTDYGPAPRKAWGNTEGASDKTQSDQPKVAEDAEPAPTPGQALAKQMVSRSIYFLTHASPVIRARILNLLSSATPVLSESALLPSIHQAWPFILNRLNDAEPFVVSAAAGLVESLVTHVGSFMGRRVWDDVWPRFDSILKKLDVSDHQNALTRRGYGAVGTESAYTHSHRLYRSTLRTMTAAVAGVHMQDTSGWQVILAFRRFLHKQAHEELQACARELYAALAKGNGDAVWLALMATCGRLTGEVAILREYKWDIRDNVCLILNE